MSNWKAQAKNLIKQTKLIEAIGLIEANGIETGGALSAVQALDAESEKHAKNKTPFTSAEYSAHSKKFSQIARELLQKIDGTNRPMPDYLKE